MFEVAEASHVERPVLPDQDNPLTKRFHKKAQDVWKNTIRAAVWSATDDEDETDTSMDLINQASRFERLYNQQVAQSNAAEERQNNERSSHGHAGDSTYTRGQRRARSRSPWNGGDTAMQ